MTTTQDTERHTIWTAARQGWKASIVVGLAVLLIRFKALIPLVWQLLVKNGSVHTIGKALADLVVIAGGILFIYAVRTGYRRSSQALEDTPGSAATALRVIGRTSLLINAPILYWALFLFVLLPQLVKIPNASLRIGTTAALAGAFIAMAVIVVLATHIGLLLIRFSFRSLTKAPELATAPLGGGAGAVQPLPFAQQATYVQPGGYIITAQAPASGQPGPYGPQGGYYLGGNAVPNQMLTYAQQAGYPVSPRVVGAGNGPAAQAPLEPGPSSSGNLR